MPQESVLLRHQSFTHIAGAQIVNSQAIKGFDTARIST